MILIFYEQDLEEMEMLLQNEDFISDLVPIPIKRRRRFF